MPEVHAKLSASGSHIWLNCTPAIRLSEGIPDKTTTFAEEGTVAHRLAELTLLNQFDRIDQKTYKRELKKVKSSEYYNEAMEQFITTYTEWVLEEFDSIKALDKELMTEQRIDFSEWVPDGFGTSDVTIVADGVLTVIDLKYGAGVPVSAVDNPQLMLYGLGAYDAYSLSNDIHTVRMIINQPRLDSISEFEISVADLLIWGDEIVKPKAEMAMAGEGAQVPGEHCRFCKVKNICRARAEAAFALEGLLPKDPRLLTDDEIGEVLTRAEAVSAWVSDAKKYIMEQALEGRHFEGWKLVEGKSNRKYTDVKEVEKRLLAAGFDKVLLYKDPELLGLTAMEKVVGGKKKLETICEGLIVKPQGAPTLVPESDKRPALTSASVYDDGYTD